MVRMYVFDVETDGVLDATRENWFDLRITVVVGMDAESGTRDNFMFSPGADVAALMDALAVRLEDADVIVAYNGRGFDFRMLAAHHFGVDQVNRWLRKLADPFEAVRYGCGSWVKLDEMLAANGLPRKTGDGRDAVNWWKAGEHDKVLDYCACDVQLLRDLVYPLRKLRVPVKSWDANTHTHRVVGWKKLDWPRYVDRICGIGFCVVGGGATPG